MIIEETDLCYELLVFPDGTDYLKIGSDDVTVDKQQAEQLIEVLAKWVAGEEIN